MGISTAIGIGIQFSRGGGQSWETELTTYITGLTTPLSNKQKINLNNFIKELKTGLSISNLSDFFDAMYLLAGETSESSLKNIVKNLTHATNSNAVFTAFKGFRGNGSSAYVNSNFASSTHGVNYTLNSAAIGVRVNYDYNLAHCNIGARENSVSLNGASYIFPRYTGVAITQINESGEDTFANANAVGLYIASRNSENQLRSYKDLVGQNKVITGGTLTDRPFYILARNDNNRMINPSLNQVGFAFMGKAVTDDNVAVIKNAYDNYITATQSDAFAITLSNWGFNSYNQNSAQYFNGVTYITYSGNDDDPYIITYTHSTDTWSSAVKVGTNPLNNSDWHGSPSMLIDSSGYIHVMWGAHNSAIQYSKSTNPEDISAWTSMSSPNNNSTYVRLFQIGSLIYLFYRSGGNPFAYRTSNDGGSTWSGQVSVSDNVAYWTVKQYGNYLLFAGVGRDTTGYDLYNIYFLYFDGTNWKDGFGTNVALPFDPDEDNILIYDSGAATTPTATPYIDGDGNLYIFFMELTAGTGDPIGTFDYRILKFNGLTWDDYDIGVDTPRNSADASAIEMIGSTLYVYLTTGGNSALMGGNLERWKSIDAGITWTKDKTIKIGNYVMPLHVKDGLSNAKIVFSEFNNVNTDFNLYGYLWGENGFV